ncbi:MAG TPA: peptidase S10 [Caulobacteraceae bacterium]|jgi:carboxypeptidase C (cathepsin A)|nr:peptidase S10 [Caulobacteraceae bacterium]
MIGRTAIALTALLFATTAAAAPNPAAPDPATQAGAVTTQHTVDLAGGRKLAYTAEAGRITLRDAETGEPHGYMFYTAYRVRSDKPRPVTFIWNGGPGADSSTLHFHVAGPVRVVDGQLVENPDTWLAASDLVFVDPVGTGFSRPAKAEYADEFYGTVGDVASVAEFVRNWLLQHHADGAPVWLVGESWGAGRAGSVGAALEKRGVKVSGMVLLSGGSGLHKDFIPRELSEALHVADLNATAAYWHRAKADPQAAERWARVVYAPALAHRDQLSDADRAKIVTELSAFTGLSADQIDPKTLLITPRQYRSGLLKSEGKTLNTFDMRITAEPKEGADVAAILRYLRHDLGYHTDLPYVGLEPAEGGYGASVGERWNYATEKVTPEAYQAALAEAMKRGGGPPVLGAPLPSTAEEIALDPGTRVLVAAGLYDSLNSCAANAETGKRLPSNLAKAITFRCYTGGHMMYRDEPTRIRLSDDIKAMIGGR